MHAWVDCDAIGDKVGIESGKEHLTVLSHHQPLVGTDQELHVCCFQPDERNFVDSAEEISCGISGVSL